MKVMAGFTRLLQNRDLTFSGLTHKQRNSVIASLAKQSQTLATP